MEESICETDDWKAGRLIDGDNEDENCGDCVQAKVNIIDLLIEAESKILPIQKLFLQPILLCSDL